MTLPSIGWHVTEATDSYCLERFFDGAAWSAPCYSDDPEHIRGRARRTPAETEPEVWSESSCACRDRESLRAQ